MMMLTNPGGAATALSVGFTSSGIALFIGIFLGSLAGYYGKWVDNVIVWLYTTIDSIPYILLIPSLTFVLGLWTTWADALLWLAPQIDYGFAIVTNQGGDEAAAASELVAQLCVRKIPPP